MDKQDPSAPPGNRNRRQLLKLAVASALGATAFENTASAASKAPAAPTGSNADVLDVAIIGAGLSGLTAARDLRLAGCESFVVLEARNRVGGRTFNEDLGGGFISEVGGQWIGPGQTAVADLARQLQVGTFPTYYQGKTVVLGGNGRLEADFEGGFGTDETIAEKLSEMSRDVPSGAPWKSPKLAELDRLSVGDWLAKQNVKPEERSGWDSSIVLTGGAGPSKMGLLHFLSMINSADCKFDQLEAIKDSAQGTRFVGGSQILSIKMAQQLTDRVRLGSPVRKISDWDKDIVSLQTDGGTVRARRVVMALSPPLCQQIQFDPPLPPKRAALQRAWPGYSPGRKTATVYSRPFWRDKGLNGSIFTIAGMLIWAYDNSPPGGEIGVINAFMYPGHLSTDLEAGKRQLLALYEQAFGEEALSPVSHHDHDWGRADPWTITCVSAIPPGFWSTHGEALHPPCGRLIWSGTETADIWAGYMDGAVRSGHRAALQVLGARAGLGETT